jgi:hypothetical protein
MARVGQIGMGRSGLALVALLALLPVSCDQAPVGTGPSHLATQHARLRREGRRLDVAARPDALLTGAVGEALTALDAPVSPVPDAFVRRIQEQLRLMQRTGAMPLLWRRRTALWPVVEEAMTRRGLPAQLGNLAWPESNFLAQTCSRRGARGYWQLVPAAAEHLNLHVDEECAEARPEPGRRQCPCEGRDDRLDLARSSDAAARLLAQFTQAFGRRDVLLGIAAYNVGPGRIERLLEAQGLTRPEERGFWSLYRRGALPESAAHLAADVVAVTVVALHPERYGLARAENLVTENETPRPPLHP